MAVGPYTLASNDVVQVVIKGACGDTPDMENVQYFLYVPGLSPLVGGLTLDTAITQFLIAWAPIFTGFMGVGSSFEAVTGRVISSVTGLGGNKWKGTATAIALTTAHLPGTRADALLPSFNAFGIRKNIITPGRGKQGHLRQWGVTENEVAANELDETVRLGLEDAINPDARQVDVTGGFASDLFVMGTVDGKAINTDPGHTPNLYFNLCSNLSVIKPVSTQVTRKIGRHRR